MMRGTHGHLQFHDALAANFKTWEFVQDQSWHSDGQIGTGAAIRTSELLHQYAVVQGVELTDGEFRARLKEAHKTLNNYSLQPSCTAVFYQTNALPIIYDDCLVDYYWSGPPFPARILLGKRRA